MTSSRSGLRRELRLGSTVGVVGGAFLGAREGLSTLLANAFVEAGHYLLAYLVTPIALWCLLGPLLLLPLAVLLGASGARHGVAIYVGALTGAGLFLGLLPLLEDATVQMKASGVPVGSGTDLLLVVFATLLAIGAGALAGGGVRPYGDGLERVLPRVAVVVVLAVVLATAVSGRQLLLDALPSDPTPAGVTARSDAPNVVLVSIDTLRADELGAYGSGRGTTPVLDRFAAEGMTFRNAFAAAPWTLPSVASLMTGLYPRHHAAGAVANRYDPLGRSSLSPDVPTLAALLAAQGYRTHAIVTNPYLLGRYGLQRGFETYDNLTFLSEAMLAGRRNAVQWIVDHVFPSLVAADRGRDVSDRAVRWLDSTPLDRPFLLWVHYIDAHAPYEPVAGSRHKSFRGDSLFGARRERSARGFVAPDVARLRSGEVRLDDAQKQMLRALYRREVADVDRQVGRVLDALHGRGLDDRTLVVCVSDHGEEFWDHGGVEHGHTLYDELLHVPLMMRWPGHFPAGLTIDPVVRLVDVAPTLAGVVGVDPDTTFDGRSLLPLVQGTNDERRTVLAENLLFAEERVALRTATYKYVRWTNGKEELYDVVHDPAELRDLAGRDDVVAALRVELLEVENAMAPAVVPGRAPPTNVAALRALGYAQ